jgi:formate dehydrogenase maturation protein FdhE
VAKRVSAAYDWPEPIRGNLLKAKKEQDARAKKRVKFCPICGNKPEETPQNEGRHIYSVRCDKCQARMTVWVTG